MEDVVLVGVGGAVGAACRYGVGIKLFRRAYPIPTVVVNVVGSFLLGLVIAVGAGDRLLLLVGIGFCGAFTTYSTFSVDTVRLWDESPFRAVVYAVGTLLACILAVGVAYGVGAVLTG